MCPTRTLTKPVRTAGNATAGEPKSASPKACVRSVEESLFLPTAGCAKPAVRRSARPSAPGTPGPRPKAGSTEAGIRRAAAGTGGREAGSASRHIGTPACARAVVVMRPSRAARPVRLAVTSGKWPNGSFMRPGGQRANAAGAGDQSLEAPHAAVPALLSRPGATQRRTRPAEGATPKGGRAGVARTVVLHRRERRGACRARTGHGCGRASIGACRSFHLATP